MCNRNKYVGNIDKVEQALIFLYNVKVHYENSTLQWGVSTLSIQKPTNKPHLLRCGKTQRLFDNNGYDGMEGVGDD